MILVVHPLDPSTKALNRVGNHLKVSFPEVHVFKVHPNDKSRFDSYEAIRNCKSNDIIVFLGHGSSFALYGSKGNMYDKADFVSHDAQIENPESYYYNEIFINKDNWDILRDKRLICVSCRSNSFGKDLFDRGIVHSIIGFGNLPTSIGEFKEMGIEANSHLIAWMKGDIYWIIKRSIAFSLNKDYSFSRLGDLIRFVIQQRIAMHLHSNNRFRFILANQLVMIKDEMLVKEKR